MQQIYLESAFKRGYRRLMKYISNIAHFDRRIQAVIMERIKIIEFFDEFGSQATAKAFNRSRSTIFLWKKKLKDSDGKLSSLAPTSTAPKIHTKRVWQPEIVNFIKEYRKEHPGADKVTLNR